MTAEEKAERQLVVDNNRAWKAAEPVRRQWVRDLVGRKKPPKGLLRWCVSEVMREPGYVGDSGDGLLAETMGVDSPAGTHGREVGIDQVAKSTEAALPLVLFAQIAADRERHMDASTQPGRMTWRAHRATEARYLVQLRDLGYTLSDVEQLVVSRVFPPDAADAAGSDRQESIDGGELGDVDETARVVVLPTADMNGYPAEPAPLSAVPDLDGDGDPADVTPLAVVPNPDGEIDGPPEGDTAVRGDTA